MTSVEDLCKGVPDEFATLINYARLLRYYEMPDYKSITTLFRHLVENASIDLDEPYDWEKTDRSPDTGSPVLKLTRSKPSLPRIQAGSDDSISQFACSLCTTNSHSLCVSNWRLIDGLAAGRLRNRSIIAYLLRTDSMQCISVKCIQHTDYAQVAYLRDIGKLVVDLWYGVTAL